VFFNGFTLLLCLLSAIAGGLGYRWLFVSSREYYAKQEWQRKEQTPLYDQLADEWGI
jgi:hypothetical protein